MVHLPCGLRFGYRQGAVDDSILYVVYVHADLVNKIAFCLAMLSSPSSPLRVLRSKAHKVCENDPNMIQYAGKAFCISRVIILVGGSIFPLGTSSATWRGQ